MASICRFLGKKLKLTINQEKSKVASTNEISFLGFIAAGTDALKKCATLLGVGLHLYGEKPQGRSQNSSNPRRPQGNHGGNGGHQRTGGNGGRGTGSGFQQSAGNGGRKNGNGGGNGRLSNKQYNYIVSLATRDLAMTRSELDNLCLEMFSTTCAYLSRQDASTIIEHLLAR